MTYLPNSRGQMIFAFAGSLLAPAMLFTDTAAANTTFNTSKAATNTTSNTLMDLYKKSGIRVGGWINGGATFNPSHIDGFNGPVTFGDQANRFQLNQFNVFIERAVVAEGSKWDFGGRVDVLFGTDSIFTPDVWRSGI